MDIVIAVAGFLWGAVAGYIMLRVAGCLMAILFSLHGLLMTRWKRLKNRATPGQIAYDIILNQLFRAGFFGALFIFLLLGGDKLMWGEFRFDYKGQEGIVWAVAFAIVVLVFARKLWRNLVTAWKVTHEVDYAHKRQRTALLR